MKKTESPTTLQAESKVGHDKILDDDLSDTLNEQADDMYKKFNQNDILPWIEKYRPKKLDEVISHDEIISTIKIFIKNRCLPHLLLYGPPGTGKTSTISACARELYGEYYQYMVMELNASDDRGIDVVRSRIKQFVISENAFFGKNIADRNNIFKLVILDETDAMTSDAQAILRKIVEKYTYNTRFCLVCNDIQNINMALQSRCTRFRFPPLKKHEIRTKIISVAKQESIKLTEQGIATIIKISNGDMRKVLNILQSTSMAYPVISEKNVTSCIGYPKTVDIDELLNGFYLDTFEESCSRLDRLININGLFLNDIINEIHTILCDRLMTNITCNTFINHLNEKQILHILDDLRSVEHNNMSSTIEAVQIAAFVSVFFINKN